jgi:hypothetical protein
MKLELKHLAGYLPYRLKVSNNLFPYDINTVSGLKNETYFIENESKYAYGDIYTCKPILRPLSDLKKEIEVNGEKFVPKDWIGYNYIGENLDTNIATWSHRTIQKLLEWHFDIYGLIEQNLAIDINTL